MVCFNISINLDFLKAVFDKFYLVHFLNNFFMYGSGQHQVKIPAADETTYFLK